MFQKKEEDQRSEARLSGACESWGCVGFEDKEGKVLEIITQSIDVGMSMTCWWISHQDYQKKKKN